MAKQVPKPEAIATIFPACAHTLNLIHFATDEKETLLQQLIHITREFGGTHFDGFQLNVKWPDVNLLRAYKRAFPDKRIVVQCGGGAQKDVGNDPVRLAQMIAIYDDVADYALIDPSGGLGKVLDQEDVEFAQCCLAEIASMHITMGIGIAGGLGPDTMNHIAPIVAVHSDISIDAEGRLRDTSDHLDRGSVEKYIKEAKRVFA